MIAGDSAYKLHQLLAHVELILEIDASAIKGLAVKMCVKTNLLEDIMFMRSLSLYCFSNEI